MPNKKAQIKYVGWIGEFTGPESFENAQPDIPEEVLQRLDKAWNNVFGGRPKTESKSQEGQRKVG